MKAITAFEKKLKIEYYENEIASDGRPDWRG
jgi:hypothetical protein